MVILLNPKSTPVKVQYISGNQVYNKELRPFMITSMKSLDVSGQIENITALANEGVTIYNYELDSYVTRGTSGGFTFGAATAPYAFQFIPHNVKREAYKSFNSATMSGGSQSLKILFTGGTI